MLETLALRLLWRWKRKTQMHTCHDPPRPHHVHRPLALARPQAPSALMMEIRSVQDRMSLGVRSIGGPAPRQPRPSCGLSSRCTLSTVSHFPSGTHLEIQPLPVLFLENLLPTWCFLGWPTKCLYLNPYLRISWGAGQGGHGGQTKSSSSIAKPSSSPSMSVSSEQSLLPAPSSILLSLWMPRRAWQKDLHLSLRPEEKSL